MKNTLATDRPGVQAGTIHAPITWAIDWVKVDFPGSRVNGLSLGIQVPSQKVLGPSKPT